MARFKVTVVGAGMVGGTTAQRIAERDYANVVLVDIVEGLPQGKSLDMLEAGPLVGHDALITGVNGYDDTSESDVVVITSGIPRKPGMSRDDLLQVNSKIVREVTENIVKRSPDAVLIVVSNPLDAMVGIAHRVSGFAKQRVVGMAGALDAARFRTFIAMELQVSFEDVDALVLGAHGDRMVPLVRYASVAGIPVRDLLSRERLDAIVQRTRRGGAEIGELLKTGSAFYAPSAGVAEMVDSILLDKRRVIPSAAYLEGEYGVSGIFMGVPCVLGRRGVERIIELELDDEEKAQVKESAEAIRELWDAAQQAEQRAGAPA